MRDSLETAKNRVAKRRLALEAKREQVAQSQARGHGKRQEQRQCAARELEEKLREAKQHEAHLQEQVLIRLLRHNVRVPDRVMGDIWSQLAAHQLMARRLQELLDEQGLSDLEALSEAIVSTSRRAMQQAIREMPNGEYAYSLQTDDLTGRL